jgi:hypothetical protein
VPGIILKVKFEFGREESIKKHQFIPSWSCSATPRERKKQEEGKLIY